MGLQPMPPSNRRWFLRLGAAFGAALAACKQKPVAEEIEPSSLGKPISAYGERSQFEQAERLLVPAGIRKNPEIGSTRTPLQDFYGILTPSSLHFERHHSGVPHIDPATHPLVNHGMGFGPLILT